MKESSSDPTISTNSGSAVVLNALRDIPAKSLTAIASETNLTIDAVHGILKRLIDIGLPLDIDQNEMVRVYRNIIPLDIDYIENKLFGYDPEVSRSFTLLESVDSTNEFLISRCTSQTIHKHICVAEHMTQGRGSRNRKWLAGAFENIMLSIGWEFHHDVRSLSGLSLVVAVLVVRSLERLTKQHYQVKWPNDVLWNKQKLSGILVEIKDSSVVVGVGVNCRLSESEVESIEQPSVSLSEFFDIANRRSELVTELIIELCEGLALFFREGLTPFKDEWMKLHAYHNQRMQHDGNPPSEGIAVGINDSGALMLKLDSNQIIPIHAGQVRPVD